MQHVLGFLAASCVLVMGASAQENPVSKAIELLTDLQTKITAEGEASKKAHAEAGALCHDRSRDLGFAIQTQEAEVADSQATIEQESATISTLGQKIEDLGASLAQNDADLKAATEIREKEASDFVAEEKELQEIVSTLERAISILKREMQKSGSFLQGLNNKPFVQAMSALVQASVFSAADASRLTTLIQNDKSQGLADDELSSLGAPEAAVYEGHSHGIIETLEDLLDKAQDQLADARKKEATAAHNFNMLEQSLKDETSYMSKDMSDSKTAMAQSSAEKASAQGDLAATSKSLSADQESLKMLTQNCEQGQKDFEEESASRAEELAAIAGALKALSDMTGGAASISYGLSQVSFLQRSSLSTIADLAGFEVVRVIRDLARREHEPRLSQLASRVATMVQQGAGSGEDPFAKVKGLISDLIAKLQQEASADASAKAYCDEELAKSSAKKADKAEEVDRLTANIDKMSSQSAKLKEEIAALHKDLAELASTKAEMDKLRKEEHEAFTRSKADMEMGLQGVAAALKLLREYYAKEDTQHDAAQGSGTSIIGLLEVVESDFSKDLATISSTEASAQSAYETSSHQNEVTKVSKEQDVKYKTKESAALDRAVSQASSDRANVQAELNAVSEYLEKLEESCTAKAMSYEERKRAREEEIAGLKEALSILESETALLQQRAKRAKRALRLRRFGD